jgi:ubiquinone/menaquinone biosynthesis C-methylase UbiE
MGSMVGDGRDWGARFAASSSDALGFYDDVLVPRMFDPWATRLLDELAVPSGARVLDIATGPGTVARQAALRAGPSGAVIACDLSPAMLAIASTKSRVVGGAPIEYLECPADALTVADRCTDVVTCQQGLQFFPDRRAALREMRRVIRPGGQIGLAVWCAIEQCPPMLALADALAAVLGESIAASYRAGPWGFGNRDELERLVSDAGFSEVVIGRYALPVRFEGGAPQLLSTLAATPVADRIAALEERGRAELFAVLAREVAPICEPDGAIVSDLASHIAIARRPT